MGGQNTKSENVVGHLNGEECSRLKKLFNSMSIAGKHDKIPGCTYGDFQTHCEKYLDDWLARRLADKLSVKNPKGEDLIVPLSNFLNFISTILKGSLEEKVELIWNLAIEKAPEKRTAITTEEILQYTRSIFESYLKCVENTRNYKSWAGCERLTMDTVSDFAEFILIELFYVGVAPKEIISKNIEKKEYTQDDLLNYLSKSALFVNLHNCVLSECFNFDKVTYFQNLIPLCMKPQNTSNVENFTVLDMCRLFFINCQLPAEFRSEWRFLYSTTLHGESFSKLMSQIQDKGATVLILKDAKGRVFGALAAQSWTVGPKFFGDHQSFFFHILPKFVVYSSTGYNDNFQYLNIQQQTFPNGLGMGGKLGYFGLWIDAEFGKGKCSPSCTTFASPQLSFEEDFDIHQLEVWAVGPEPVKDENERDVRSILDKNPDAKVMLDVMDKRQYSDGIRDVPEDN